MISKKNKANLFLIIIIFLASIFYFYFINKNKGSIQVGNNQNLAQLNNNLNIQSGVTTFSDVEYKISNDQNKNYITKGKQAYISKAEPSLIQLDTVHSYTELKDGSVLDIKSNKAKYNKSNKTIKYYQNVIITNKKAIINAETANYSSLKNLIELEKIVYKDQQNTIKGDRAIFDTKTSNLEILMNNKKNQVYGQRKQK